MIEFEEWLKRKPTTLLWAANHVKDFSKHITPQMTILNIMMNMEEKLTPPQRQSLKKQLEEWPKDKPFYRL